MKKPKNHIYVGQIRRWKTEVNPSFFGSSYFIVIEMEFHYVTIKSLDESSIVRICYEQFIRTATEQI